MFGLNKTNEDKLEDEKHEQMIEEYHKMKLPPVEWDFPEFIIESKDEDWYEHGYLEDAKSSDNEGIDVWIGTDTEQKLMKWSGFSQKRFGNQTIL